MDKFYKKEFDTVFWRNREDAVWATAKLDNLIDSYQGNQYTVLVPWETVRGEESGKELYYVYRCDECDKLILSVDEDPDFAFCPYCGRAILPEVVF